MTETTAKTGVSPPRWVGLHSEYSPSKVAPDIGGEPGRRSETRVPHLVNYGASRLSTTVTFVPLPEHGRLVIGLPDRSLPPDVSIQGMGVEVAHAVLEADGGRVLLRPQADMTTVDGIRCSAPTLLASGCMLCFGRSHYFKYLCPAGYETSSPARDYLPMSRVPALDNPEYYHMATDSDTAGELPAPPPKPPRLPASEASFSRGEYLYTRLERPAVPVPAARGPPRQPAAAAAAAAPSPYDNVPATRRGARPVQEETGDTGPLTEEQLTRRHRQAMEERQRLGAWQQLEQTRLDEILNMCAEYECQMSSPPPPPSPAPRPPGSPAPFHSRIKTNGSLPRDRRLGSPGAATPPETRHRSDSDDELSAGEPSGSLRSPYENVGFAAYPQSPRTRIRTTLQRERQEAREASPPQPGAVYMVPPPPVPLSGGAGGDSRHSMQFENKEYMHDLPLDVSFQRDDHIFMPAASCGYVNTAMDEETSRAAAATSGRDDGSWSSADPRRVSWRDEPDADQLASLGRPFSDAPDEDREMCRRLKDQRRMTYRQLSELRQQKLDLEHQESESIRQLEVEYALLEGEVETHAERLQQLTDDAAGQKQALAGRTASWEQNHNERLAESQELAARIVTAEAELERLEQLSDRFRGTTDEETQLLEKLKYQHELVEQERKAHEDQEFHHMEEQVAWEAEKEESLRLIHQLETKIARARSEMESVREQQRSLIESIRRDTEAMEQQRRDIVKQMCQERDQLRRTQRRLSSLSQSGLDEAADDPVLQEPELSSDPDEFSNEYIESRLAQLHILGKSRDDLQRIQNVTASSPMQQVDNRSSNTLREIERNRHVLLAKQGIQVLEDERRRVEELKRRVQDEVTAQWEERRRWQADAAAAGSADSGDSDDSVVGSDADAAVRQRVANGDGLDAAERSSGDAVAAGAPPVVSAVVRQQPPVTTNGQQPVPGDTNGQQPASVDSNGQQPASVDSNSQQPASEDEPADDARPRPVSDASSVFDGVEEAVRRRGKLPISPKQRPLTRYMPITNEQFDLRQHIESAGHQLEVCPQLYVTRHVCRGYLHKLSARLRSWQRRWFVFDRSRNRRTFMYYADKSENKVKGGVYFQAIEEVYVDHLKAGRGSAPNTTFCIKTMSRTFFLMAPSPEAMRIWVDVVMTGAEGHGAFGHV